MSIYSDLNTHLQEYETTYGFHLGKAKMIFYVQGKRLEEKVADLKENNDLEEIHQDINLMNTSFSVQNAEAIFARGGTHTEKHEEEIESWNDLNQEKLEAFVKQMLLISEDLQLVDFALLIGNHLENPSKELIEMYIKFGAAADTTYFALPLLRKQKNADALLFKALQISSGSALLELIEEVNPNNEEKIRWMLKNGRDPFLDWWNSAACIAERCHVTELLERKDLPQEELIDIAGMISCYFAEGPAAGLYERVPDWYEQMEKILALYFERPIGMTSSICNMQQNVEREEDRDPRLPSFARKCSDALQNPAVHQIIKTEVQNHHDAYEDALLLGIDCKEEIRQDLFSSFPMSIGYAEVFREDHAMLAYILKRINEDPLFHQIQSRKMLYAYFQSPRWDTLPCLLDEAFLTIEEYLPFFQIVVRYGGGADAAHASILLRKAAENGSQIPQDLLKETEKWNTTIQFEEVFEKNDNH